MALTVEDVQKYTYGTDYFLIDHRPGSELTPITYNISYDGNEFTFMPSEVITDNTCGYASVKITDKSLLSGVTKIMALATSFAVQYTSKSESMSDKEKDKRFIFTSEAKKENTVDLYVNYTNNMVFNEDAEQYNLLKPFIFPSYRVSKYTTDHNEYQEKELLHIPFILDDNHKSVYPVPRFGYATVDKSPSKYYKDFLSAFNREDKEHYFNFEKNDGRVKIKDILSSLQVKDQIDVPSKLVLFGVCDRFGHAQKGNKGICAILYINHKITVDKYVIFKEKCDEQLEKYLKQFNVNLTVDDIKNMTTEKLKSLYGNDFRKVALLTKICGYVKDPREIEFKRVAAPSTYYKYMQDSQYSEEYGLRRWEGIKKYYPELFNAFKNILDYFLSLKDDYSNNFKKEYMDRINQLGNKHMENLLADESQLGDDPTKILKYIKKYLKDLGETNIENWEDLIDVLHMVSQGILDIFSDIYTERYKEDIRNYSYKHPKAKNAELVTSYIEVLKAIEELFEYRPFEILYLPESLKNMLDDYKYGNLWWFLNYFSMDYLINCRIFNNDQLLNFKQRSVKSINPEENDKLFRVYNVNIKDALKTLNVNFFIANNNTDNITQNRKFKGTPSGTSIYYDDKIYKYPSEVKEKFVNTLLSSGAISFELIWYDKQGDSRITLEEPISDNNPDVQLNKSTFGYNTTVDDIIKGYELDENTISKFIDYKIILKFDENAINANLNKLKAILDQAEKEIDREKVV